MKHQFNLFPNPIFVETGSYEGYGIKRALEAGCFKEVHSIELSEYYYARCTSLYKDNPKVHLHFGNTVYVLPKILEQINEPITFWLGAH